FSIYCYNIYEDKVLPAVSFSACPNWENSLLKGEPKRLLGKAFGYCMACPLLIASLWDAPTMPGRGTLAPHPPEADVKLKEANSTLDTEFDRGLEVISERPEIRVRTPSISFHNC